VFAGSENTKSSEEGSPLRLGSSLIGSLDKDTGGLKVMLGLGEDGCILVVLAREQTSRRLSRSEQMSRKARVGNKERETS